MNRDEHITSRGLHVTCFLALTATTLLMCSCRSMAPLTEPAISVQPRAAAQPGEPLPAHRGATVPSGQATAAPQQRPWNSTPAPVVSANRTSTPQTPPPAASSGVTLVAHTEPVAGVEPGHPAKAGKAVARRTVGHRLGGHRFGGRLHQTPCNGCATGLCGPGAIAPDMPPAEPCPHGHWPCDEFICNGGDHDLKVNVQPDWTVNGLHEGDTIVHYDTLDGKIEVVPTCEVCIYAPRFAAVRQVLGPELHEQHELAAGVDVPLRLEQEAELALATTVVQPLQPRRNVKFDTPNTFRERTLGVGLEDARKPAVAEKGFLPYEDFLIIRRGVFDNTEKARINPWLQAAVAWTHDQAPQVVIDDVPAVESSSSFPLESVYTYDVGGKPCLRVCKVASKHNAKPGDLVDFTIRFDNVGDRVIGNVTVIDNLNTRLAYVEDSQESSLKAEFSSQPNEHDSSVLRWEIQDPLPVGEGGVIRFQCRVQ